MKYYHRGSYPTTGGCQMFNDKKYALNYRVISQLSVLEKFREIIIRNKLKNFAEEKKLLTATLFVKK